jgi:hypothetical protein
MKYTPDFLSDPHSYSHSHQPQHNQGVPTETRSCGCREERKQGWSETSGQEDHFGFGMARWVNPERGFGISMC